RALRSTWLAWQRLRHGDPADDAAPARGHSRARDLAVQRFGRPALAAIAVALVVGALWRRRRNALRRGPLPATYADALALLERERGLVREPTVAAREFARSAARAMPPAAAAAFWSLTEAYLAERFGG